MWTANQAHLRMKRQQAAEPSHTFSADEEKAEGTSLNTLVILVFLT